MCWLECVVLFVLVSCLLMLARWSVRRRETREMLAGDGGTGEELLCFKWAQAGDGGTGEELLCFKLTQRDVRGSATNTCLYHLLA